MTFVRQEKEISCFVSCSEDKINKGRCHCRNLAIAMKRENNLNLADGIMERIKETNYESYEFVPSDCYNLDTTPSSTVGFNIDYGTFDVFVDIISKNKIYVCRWDNGGKQRTCETETDIYNFKTVLLEIIDGTQ